MNRPVSQPRERLNSALTVPWRVAKPKVGVFFRNISIILINKRNIVYLQISGIGNGIQESV